MKKVSIVLVILLALASVSLVSYQQGYYRGDVDNCVTHFRDGRMTQENIHRFHTGKPKLKSYEEFEFVMKTEGPAF